MDGHVIACGGALPWPTFSGRAMKTKSNNGEGESYRRQASLCKALANPTRLQLIAMLGRKSCWASELQAALGISKANLSQHLSVLRAAGVVSAQRDGKQLYCGIALPQVRQASLLLKNLSRTVSRSRARVL
jgi:DNA-binding transcriptional ArsR family regulator